MYLNADEELPVCLSFVNEQQFLDLLVSNPNSQETIVVPDDDSDAPGSCHDDSEEHSKVSKLKSCREVLESVCEIKLFFL